MSAKEQARIRDLQAQLVIARAALIRIKAGCRDPERTAETALDRMMPLDSKYPLQGVVGHEQR